MAHAQRLQLRRLHLGRPREPAGQPRSQREQEGRRERHQEEGGRRTDGRAIHLHGSSRLLVAGQNGQRIVRAFPGRQEIEVAELLRQLDGLVDHPLLRLVVADLDIARSSGSPCAADAPGSHSRSAAGAGPDAPRTASHTCRTASRSNQSAQGIDAHGAGHRLDLVGGQLDPHPRVPRHRQQVIDHLEPLGSRSGKSTPHRSSNCWKPNRIRAAPSAPTMSARCDDQRQFAERHLRLDGPASPTISAPERRQRGGRISAMLEKRNVHRSMVPVRRIFFCSCSSPYSSASAVGGHPGT